MWRQLCIISVCAFKHCIISPVGKLICYRNLDSTKGLTLYLIFLFDISFQWNLYQNLLGMLNSAEGIGIYLFLVVILYHEYYFFASV